MIKRYATEEMSRIWSDKNKFETWKKVELTVAEVMSDRNLIPKNSFNNIKKNEIFGIKYHVFARNFTWKIQSLNYCWYIILIVDLKLFNQCRRVVIG